MSEIFTFFSVLFFWPLSLDDITASYVLSPSHALNKSKSWYGSWLVSCQVLYSIHQNKLNAWTNRCADTLKNFTYFDFTIIQYNFLYYFDVFFSVVHFLGCPEPMLLLKSFRPYKKNFYYIKILFLLIVDSLNSTYNI